MLLTADVLANCTRTTILRAAMWVDPLQNAMPVFHIDTKDRAGMFLANVAHETGQFRYMAEIWGPTPQQMRYDPPTDLAARLGNAKPGDGRRYKGRGGIQITGLFNYQRVRNELRKVLPNVPDFEASPELLESPAWACYSACWYFESHGCNEYADRGDFDGVCDIINRGRKTIDVGDSNGYYERLQFWMGAQKVLGLT